VALAGHCIVCPIPSSFLYIDILLKYLLLGVRLINKFQRNQQHETQDEDKQNKKHNTTQKTKKMSNTDPGKNWE